MRKERVEGGNRIAQEVMLLESILGIKFENPPTVERMSIFVTRQLIIDELNKTGVSGPLKQSLLSFTNVLAPILHITSMGMYSAERNTFFVKKSKRKEENFYREKKVYPPDMRRFIALHELTHAYLSEQGPDKGQPRKDFAESLRNSADPGQFDQLIIDPLWHEGMCDLSAIIVEEQLISNGEVAPENSFALKRKSQLLTGKNHEDIELTRQRKSQESENNRRRNRLESHFEQTVPKQKVEDILPDPEWLNRCKTLIFEGYRHVQRTSFTRTFGGNANKLFFGVKSDKIPQSFQYVIGFQFAYQAYKLLLERGYNREEAFSP
jgi:hypothetical protein